MKGFALSLVLKVRVLELENGLTIIIQTICPFLIDLNPLTNSSQPATIDQIS